MEFRTLKQMFENGLLREAIVAPAPLNGKQYQLILINANGGNLFMTKARSKDAKFYSAVESALHDAGRIGFRSVKVELQTMAS